ncbi:MAG: hypothetical protein IM504_24405 [Microcystis sp. M038S2]|jgi:hypothetical protein|uniref:hypothetical protein n=1 Tax=unclassified Microcystis TaxID=2643300 RepID=UPI00118F5F48|nr:MULTISPECIES: hypothetical protein [unclassified Microcystis]MCU7246064.1 hypothetical protein [Microcystis aeruginosa WS75]TRU63248.1 MAG: hypothetical protein EWV56_05480 [Microcystis aeruginosa Ma_QC_C_20070823_S13D]TRU66213.1 MAG: hypothetical protein EWV48_02805 [Microcystis aeruginosa Ma_QC_C_20070823_S13]MCA2685040.1 hypothetical protein [Microcystis sp. M046S2]MCA2707810.1 hypothetical protein [Microcystis sp. M038S2]
MDQPFESDVMEDLAANSSFGDEGAFDAWDGMEGEGFEGFEAEDSGSSLLFMLNQQTRCQDNILLTQKF